METRTYHGGPLDGREMAASMGEKWPAILYWRPGEDCLLGNYELRDGAYHYTGEVERVAREGLLP